MDRRSSISGSSTAVIIGGNVMRHMVRAVRANILVNLRGEHVSTGGRIMAFRRTPFTPATLAAEQARDHRVQPYR